MRFVFYYAYCIVLWPLQSKYVVLYTTILEIYTFVTVTCEGQKCQCLKKRGDRKLWRCEKYKYKFNVVLTVHRR